MPGGLLYRCEAAIDVSQDTGLALGMLKEHHMNTTTTFAAIALVTSLGTVNLNADDPIFEVSAFIVGIEGEGFAGDEATGIGYDWEFPSGGGSQYFYDVDDLPVEFEKTMETPLGAVSYGHAKCEGEVTDTSVQIFGLSTAGVGIADDGDPSQFVRAYSQVHGEFHLSIPEGATLDFELCAVTEGQTAMTQMYIRKLVNGNFQTVFEHVLFSNTDYDCLEGTYQAEAGYYQLYFSAYTNLKNDALLGQTGTLLAGSGLQAIIDFSPLPSIADINGDGKVDGIDLGRLLGAWGSSAGGGDLNGDGTVDGADLAILLGEWTG